MVVDIAVPVDGRVHEKKLGKIEKYQELRREISKLWQLRKVQVVPVVIGAPGTYHNRNNLYSVTIDFGKWMEALGIPGFHPSGRWSSAKTALLGTARILRKVLEI